LQEKGAVFDGAVGDGEELAVDDGGDGGGRRRVDHADLGVGPCGGDESGNGKGNGKDEMRGSFDYALRAPLRMTVVGGREH
jgi:hypothetical protein